MRFTVQTKEIQTAFTKLLKVAPKKSSFPILEGILVTVTHDAVTLSATDCDNWVSIQLHTAEVIDKGSMVIQAESLKLVAKLKSESLTFTHRSIVSDNRELKFSAIDASDYPLLDKNFNVPAFTLPAGELLDVIDIRYACSESQATPVLTGICFRGQQAVSCDRNRAAIKDFPANVLTREIVIPAASLDLVPSFIPKAYAGDVVAVVDRDYAYIRLSFDTVTMNLRLIDGTYPDLSKIIPREFKAAVRVNRALMIEELALARELYSSKDLKMVKMNTLDGKLQIKAENKESENSIVCTVPITFTQGHEVELIGFDADYMLEGLRHNTNAIVTISFTGKLTPFLIDSSYLLLPFRVVA